ncbi:hypothetical protein CRENBAI_019479 [Crenichthys baileyi]|uniref:Uncharacterized protein n=1 Tax=Crenichthys baileyi TaxID=28760 RepID=A0AAV9RIP3_9TELE
MCPGNSWQRHTAPSNPCKDTQCHCHSLPQVVVLVETKWDLAPNYTMLPNVLGHTTESFCRFSNRGLPVVGYWAGRVTCCTSLQVQLIKHNQPHSTGSIKEQEASHSSPEC